MAEDVAAQRAGAERLRVGMLLTETCGSKDLPEDLDAAGVSYAYCQAPQPTPF